MRYSQEATSQAPMRRDPADIDAKPQFKILGRLLGYGWGHRRWLVGAIIAMVGATLSALIIPKVLGSAIDEASAGGVRSQFVVLAGIIIAASALRGLFSYGQNYLGEAVSQRVAFSIRDDFFRKLQSLSFGFYDKQQTGNLMSKATADVEAVRMFISMGLIRGLSTVFMVVAIGGIVVEANWRLGLVCLVSIPIIAGRAIYMSKRLRRTWTLVQNETGDMATVLQENLAGARVVRSFGAAAYEEKRFDEKAVNLAEYTYRAIWQFASHGSLMMFIFTTVTGVILLVGGHEVFADRLTPGELASFIFYMGMLLMPVRMLGFMVNTLSRASSAGQRIFDTLDAESPVQEKPGVKPLPPVRGHVRFENASFSYDTGHEALNDIDFEVQPGQLVAILGAPGSGKSSIIHLIPRFYDVSSGRITIDGIDVRDVTLSSLRKSIGVVLQDVFVFAATIRDNIAYGADDVSIEEVRKAAQIAQFDDFVQSLPRGYDSWVGERGITLSGGQRQRVAIARTILLDPPVLILDDSTSSVDMSTEYQIQEALNGVVRGRTTFVIAHRLSTVRKADLILVLEDGRIEERGSHEELIRLDGYYRQIYELQLRSQEEAGPIGLAAPVAGGDGQ